MLHDKNGPRGSGGKRASGTINAPPGQVVEFFVEERLEFDPDRLVELVVMHGEANAQALIDDSLREIATLTAELVHHLSADQMPDPAVVEDLTRKIRAEARLAGLPLYQRVVRDLMKCVAREDRNAISAVLHRLVRLAACALRQSWKIADHWA